MWQTLTDSKGNSYRFWKQQKDSSCGVACVMMVASLVQRKELDESTVRGWFGEAEGSKNIDSTGVREFDRTGSTKSPIIGVLSKLGISALNAPEGSAAVRNIMQCSPSKPGILFIKWPGRGAHWIVIANFRPDSNGTSAFVCLDPWYGLVEWEARYYPTYRPNASNRSTFGSARWLIHM